METCLDLATVVGDLPVRKNGRLSDVERATIAFSEANHSCNVGLFDCLADAVHLG